MSDGKRFYCKRFCSKTSAMGDSIKSPDKNVNITGPEGAHFPAKATIRSLSSQM